MKRIIIFALAIFALCSCNNDDQADSGAWTTPYMISNYLLIEEISCFHHENQANNAIYLRFYGEDLLADLNATKDKFAYFNKMYNDVLFYKANYPGAYSALAYPFDKITLSCNSDYDAKHPAGTPLNDIVKLQFESYWDFLQNGYQYPEWYTEKKCGYGRVPLEYYLSELNSNNSKLVSIKQSPMIFTSSPATPGEYTFTLELTTNGETFTTTFTHKFE